MNKNLYEKPITDVLVIRFEDNLLNATGYHSGGGGSYDDDINNNDEY